ncbi:MAG: mannose-1-phosphate guanylyltransferase/mannose-6-phosphate isomerase [bacterium]
MSKIYPVIMCGGSGTRLWPVSVKSQPKQYQAMTGTHSMLEETILRTIGNQDAQTAPPILVTSALHRPILEKMLAKAQAPTSDIILEPMGRNTAAVAALAAAKIAHDDPDGLILLLPADHHVTNKEAFWQAVTDGVIAADKGFLVTLGIEASTPETGYGYIRKGKTMGRKTYEVEAFVEKPDLATAQSYVSSGEYFWNAGIFLFRADSMLAEFEKHQPDILRQARLAYEKASQDGTYHLLDETAFAACPDDSIDYAIMEKTDRAAVVGPVSAGWNDIGGWAAVRDVINGASGETVTRGNVMALNSENCLIRSDGPFVAAIGLNDMIVVATEKAVLITRADQSQDVKQVINQLKEGCRDNLL